MTAPPALDPLTDGTSSVELLDHMGSDLTVVNAARVSFAKESTLNAGELRAADAKLIAYLAAHSHWTPFAHPQLSFRIKMPIFVAREWYRHTVGLTRNEVSRRYVDTPPELYLPTAWRQRAPTKKQGSADETIDTFATRYHGVRQQLDMLTAYQELLANGVAPEMARMVLPQSMYTEFIETGSLYAYTRIARLRISPDAQRETRAYAEAVAACIQPLFPVSWAALTA